MIRCSLLCGLLSLALPSLAADALSGTWKFQATKGSGPGWAQYDKDGDYLVWSNSAGTMAKFKLDGKDYPGTGGKGTVSWKQIDKDTLESTSKLDGKVMSTSRMTFNPDGKNRTVVQKGVDDKGKPYESIQKSKRAGGPVDPANPLIGKWEIDRNAATGTFPPLVIDVKGNKISVSGVNAYDAAFDGKEYPVRRSLNADTVVVRRVDDRAIETTMKAGGKVVSTGKISVSSDGKMLTMNITRNNSTTTNVFTRE